MTLPETLKGERLAMIKQTWGIESIRSHLRAFSMNDTLEHIGPDLYMKRIEATAREEGVWEFLFRCSRKWQRDSVSAANKSWCTQQRGVRDCTFTSNSSGNDVIKHWFWFCTEEEEAAAAAGDACVAVRPARDARSSPVVVDSSLRFGTLPALMTIKVCRSCIFFFLLFLASEGC